MNNQDFVRELRAGDDVYAFYDIRQAAEARGAAFDRLPFSVRVLAENVLRKLDNRIATDRDFDNIVAWKKTYVAPVELPYYPARVLMQDFTGVPAVVDLAAMRDAVRDLGGDPAIVNPVVPVELVADHSVQVDFSGTVDSLKGNVQKEYERNSERYTLLKWAQNNFDNFRVVPPNSGICHQVNLEHLGRVTVVEETDGRAFAYPDTLVGLDSHTPMINALGVMGWGVGGIEAEAVMLGQPYYLSIPEVIGVRLTGSLRPGVTATDLVLTLTELLRKHKVVEKFVEYFGPGMHSLSIPDRATIANMTPEYGATLGFFPIDEKTIEYLTLTGRAREAVLTDTYARTNGFFYGRSDEDSREYTMIIDFDLATVEASLAGPARPQDRIPLSVMAPSVARMLGDKPKRTDITVRGKPQSLGDGSVVIAAITSCTNTSNPQVLLCAGLLAREAVARGLRVPEYVKTSFAPGSKVVTRYLEESGLLPYFEALGFHIAAYGCTTCIGNSGPLDADIGRAILDNKLNVAAVLSGNRNFEARIHQEVKSNYLASPPLVIAYALAGRVTIDFEKEPVGHDPNGKAVFLADLWPSDAAVADLVRTHVHGSSFTDEYAHIFEGDEFWKALDMADSTTYKWDDRSTYIKHPPYFEGFTREPPLVSDITDARVFLMLGDTVTTDHISPAGAINAEYPAGQYLRAHGVDEQDFNSYGSRRGNHEVMLRGTFGNIRIKNRMLGSTEGSYTVKYPEGEKLFNYDAALRYRAEGTPLIVLAGAEYGTGSSRDWAAKGTALLGVKAVIARSFERIHRSNLVGMGVLPLVFAEGEDSESLSLDGSEVFSIAGLADITPRAALQVVAKKADGTEVVFSVTARLDTAIEVAWYVNGGILPYVLRRMMGAGR